MTRPISRADVNEAGDRAGEWTSDAVRLLLREADHRVTNSLQLVSSLLGMQERALDDQAAREALADARRRVGCIARLHRTLCASAGAELVNLEEFLHSLSDDLWDAFLQGRRIQFLLNADPATVPAHVACSIGLSLSELVTNAIKHGFGDDGVGLIEVDCGSDIDGNIEIEVRNDAPSEDDAKMMSLDGCHGLGTKIVQSLLGQYHGTLDTFARGHTTVQRILLPAPHLG